MKSENQLKVIVLSYYWQIEQKLQIVFPKYMDKEPYKFINKYSREKQNLYFNIKEIEESDLHLSKLETFGWSKTEGWTEIDKFLSQRYFYPLSSEDPKIDNMSIFNFWKVYEIRRFY